MPPSWLTQQLLSIAFVNVIHLRHCWILHVRDDVISSDQASETDLLTSYMLVKVALLPFYLLDPGVDTGFVAPRAVSGQLLTHIVQYVHILHILQSTFDFPRPALCNNKEHLMTEHFHLSRAITSTSLLLPSLTTLACAVAVMTPNRAVIAPTIM